MMLETWKVDEVAVNQLKLILVDNQQYIEVTVTTVRNNARIYKKANLTKVIYPINYQLFN